MRTTRKKLVSFRITEEDYASFCGICAACGWSSLSDFMRSAILDRVALGSNTRQSEIEVANLGRLLRETDISLRTMRGEINRLLQVISGAQDQRRSADND